MKNKIVYIILVVIFIGILVLASVFLEQQKRFEDLEDVKNNVGNLKEEDIMEKVTNENFKEEVLNSQKTVLVDFYADWCSPCKMLSPIVTQVAEENKEIKVVKINVDEAQDIAVAYGVMSIPTLVVIKNGQEVNRSVGLVSKSEILELVK